MKFTFNFTEEDLCRSPYLNDLKAGDAVLVVSREDELGKWGPCYSLYTGDYAMNGCPGNMDKNTRRFHGWRGTSYGTAVYAHGVYTVKSVEKTTYSDIVTLHGLKVVLNRQDIKKNSD